MELQRPRLPVPLALEQQPETRVWPTVPRTSLSPNANTSMNITLPDLKTVLSPEYEQLPPSLRNGNHPFTAANSPHSTQSLPPIDVGHGRYHSHKPSIDSAIISPVESNGAGTGFEERAVRAASVVSVEDPRERIAAEVLSGLGNADYSQTKPNHMRSHVNNSINTDSRASGIAQPTPEPLLELIAQAHPWVGGTIKGSLSAYSTTKNYSPRFVQYGANLVERNITIPVVSAVSSVGEMTGADYGLRRYLGSRLPPDAENKAATAGEVQREADGSEMDVDMPDHHQESLPAYRASRPPSYRELPSPVQSDRSSTNHKLRDIRPPTSRSWSSQFLITTSGLSVALSKTSRESLRACLQILGQSAGQVQNLSGALSLVLQRYEEARQHIRLHNESALEKGESHRSGTPEADLAARELADAIQQHCDAIWSTLRWVVEAVSNSVGGALPDNARHFVRQQFMSLPQRWQIASNRESAESETSRAAQRMIGFATEGLDMLTQVSSVLKVTLDSAEKWLERVGRRDPECQDDAQRYPQLHGAYHQHGGYKDVNMMQQHPQQQQQIEAGAGAGMPTAHANPWDVKYPIQTEPEKSG